MFDDINKQFECIVELAKKNDLHLETIEKAYQKARELHSGQIRKDGTPYISHPVEVALILAKLDFDENVIAGALLHDTIEDCGYTEQEMKKDFNEIVFNLVDCVSAIDKTKYVLDKENIYEDENFVKSSAEEQTFTKLILLGKKNPCGFAIKLADRLHNLRTIETFEYPKQLEKVRETEKWVLPIAKALKSEYFYRAIKNECFKIVNRQTAQPFLLQYEMYHKSNLKNINILHYKLQEAFANSSLCTIKIKNVREYKIIEELSKFTKRIELNKISESQINKVANYNIYFLYKDTPPKIALGETIDILQNKTNLKIIDAKISAFTGKKYMVAEDEFRNKYNIFILSENEYKLLKVGTTDGQNLERIDEENINELDVDLIRVKTRSGEIKYIAKGSTVLDFAFKIHKEIGFSFKYAIVNDSKTKLPPYTKLNPNDKVEIITEKDENGVLKNNAQLRWLAYVNTELAKRVLIKWLESLIKKE